MEQPLFWWGSCNLGPINISNHVINSFEDNAEFDWDSYKQTIKLMTVLLDCMLDQSYFPLQEHYDEVKQKRLIGIGFTGLADAMCKLKIKYNSPEGIEFAEKVMRVMSEVGYMTSSKLSKEFGAFPLYSDKMLESYNVKILPDDIKTHIKQYGLRNSRISSIAPTGTTSLVMNNCSSGVEPIFSLEYNRNIKNDDGSTRTETIENDAWNLWKQTAHYKKGEVPEFFVTTNDITPTDHINIQSVIQKWCCTSVSKTINVPVNIDYQEFKSIYEEAHQKGLKGCTTYRPNGILGSVLEIKSEEKDTQAVAEKEQKEFFEIWKDHERGEIIPHDVELPSEYPMKGFKITSEGKKWYINIAFKDKKCERPFAMFVSTNNRESEINTYDAIEKLEYLASQKGINRDVIEKNKLKCNSQNNVNKIARTIGLLLRHNVKIIDIVKTLENVDVPISSFIFRIKKFLMKYVEEIPTNGVKCPDCGSPIEYKDGCQSCTDCFWSKCS